LAGELIFGSLSIEMTESIIVDTVWVGNHRSSASSPLIKSSPGGWRIEIHTRPSL
jgi:hypothetical protein